MQRKILKSLLKTTKQHEEMGSLILGGTVVVFVIGVLGWKLVSKMPAISLSPITDKVQLFWRTISSDKEPFVNETITNSASPMPETSSDSSPSTRMHRTLPTDTLWKLAIRYYNDGYKWTRIYEANKKVIPDPNTLEKDLNLVIP